MVEPFPFATVDDLKARWPDFPLGADDHAEALLEDASQFMLDVVPTTADATEATRRRIVCSVVKRAMQSEGSPMAGYESTQMGAGPFQATFKPLNGHGDFYLTKNEKLALGWRKGRAFGVQVAGFGSACHRPWCALAFKANYCSCGADIAGEPIYEA